MIVARVFPDLYRITLRAVVSPILDCSHTCSSADYFLCILYKNRDELKNPLKIWLIPTNAVIDGREVKDRSALSMSIRNIDKYSAFERVDKRDAVKTVCETVSINDL